MPTCEAEPVIPGPPPDDEGCACGGPACPVCDIFIDPAIEPDPDTPLPF